MNNKTFGIEIECYHATNEGIIKDVISALGELGNTCTFEGYSHRTTEHWKVVTDRSISGGYALEMVSPPLKGVEGVREVSEIVETLQKLGCRVNESCGLHVHHFARHLSVEELKGVFAFYRAHELLIDSIVARGRRGDNPYCKSLIYAVSDFPESRYSKLNYQSFAKYGTIEFRQHQGTLDAIKVARWIEFTQAIISKANEAKETPTLEKMLEELGVGNVSWFLERQNELK